VPAAANANIARHLGTMAVAQPDAMALKIPRGRSRSGEISYLSLTFAELVNEVAAWEARMTERGVRRGDRVLLMVKPGLPLIASAFGLFRMGAVPVIIDPGMGLKNFCACVARTRPRALVGIPLAQIIGRVFPRTFGSVAVRVPVPNSLTARAALPAVNGRKGDLVHGVAADNAPGDLAAILFTSGSTGAPKGVRYEHGMFEAQIQLLRATYGIAPGEVDLPLLPIFALFNPALGMTSIIPEIDPRRPAAVDPAKIVQAIRQEGVTNSFGSPTLWRIIGDYCGAQGITLPSLRRVLCAGAPVPAALWEKSAAFLPNGKLHSPYGATEALPVSTISADDVAALGPTGRRGAPVGRPLAGIEARIIAIVEGPVVSVAEAQALPSGEIGEIIVRGPVVTKEYDGQGTATALAKIQDGDSVWHRMGDCGYLDEGGRLWFCGRKAERVQTEAGPLHTEICEQVFRVHPRAVRCALVGLGRPGRQVPALIAETTLRGDGILVAAALRRLALAHPATAAIRRFYFRPKFPVDVRHNAKIHRLTLARWAATARGFDT
jgi:acyl-CoA synthetase (AMP-forming)/AMP-acid ligase II